MKFTIFLIALIATVSLHARAVTPDPVCDNKNFPGICGDRQTAPFGRAEVYARSAELAEIFVGDSAAAGVLYEGLNVPEETQLAGTLTVKWGKHIRCFKTLNSKNVMNYACIFNYNFATGEAKRWK